MSKARNIEYQLVRISTDQFAIIDDFYSGNIDFAINASFNYTVLEEENIIRVVPIIQFMQEKSPFMKLQVSYYFKVLKNAWSSFYSDNGESIIIDESFIKHLSLHSLEVTQGILHCKTVGTKLNHILLPLIDLSEIVEGDLKFQLKE